MAKITKQAFETGLAGLADRITASMPGPAYKFIFGGATAAMFMSGRLFDGFIKTFSCEDGMIDTEKLRQVYTAAFKSSGGKLQLQLFNKPDSIVSLFVKPVTLTVTEDDIDRAVADMEKTASQTAAVN